MTRPGIEPRWPGPLANTLLNIQWFTGLRKKEPNESVIDYIIRTEAMLRELRIH